ncbi:hypothetical protein GC194_07085 [bacterium]|nr:hypothetical protein [bacterium]
MKHTIIILLLQLFTFGNALAGGGWTQGKGHGFFMLSQRYIGGSFYANNMGMIVHLPKDKAGVLNSNLYAEYGLGKRLDVLLNSSFLTAAYYIDKAPHNYLPAGQNTTSHYSFGDTDAALKYRFLGKSLHASVTLLLGLPTGKFKPGIDGNSAAITGDGEFNQLVKVDVSGSFGKKMYASGFLGFNNRSQHRSDEIHLGGEIGHNGDKVVAILKMYLLKSLHNGNAGEAMVPGIYSNNLEYFALSPCLLYKIDDKKGIVVNLGFAPFLRNIIASPSYTVGFYLKK